MSETFALKPISLPHEGCDALLKVNEMGHGASIPACMGGIAMEGCNNFDVCMQSEVVAREGLGYGFDSEGRVNCVFELTNNAATYESHER